MKRLPVTPIAPIALAFALLATPAVADLLVTEVVGSVRTVAAPGRMQAPVATLDQIANGSELTLAASAKAVVVDLANGNEYELAGEERYMVTPSGPKSAKGAIATAKPLPEPLPEKNLPAVRISGRKASQATMIMREMEPPKQPGQLSLLQEEDFPQAITPIPGVLSLLTPLPDETVIERPLLRWSKQQGATRYRVTVLSPDRADTWITLTPTLEITTPDSLALKPGGTYRWRIEALADERTLSSAEASFSMAPAEVLALLARLKPEPDAPFSRRVLYAAQVEQAGAKSAARSLWQALSRDRQHDPVLRSRANDGESGLPLP